MKRSKFSEEQVAYALRQVDDGTAVSHICRQLGVSKATFYAWKKKYAHLGACDSAATIGLPTQRSLGSNPWITVF